MGLFYDHSVLIDSRDVDGLGRCRPSALLGHLQEAATLAAETGGFGRERLLQECSGFWMLARMWFRLKRPLVWEERLTIRTWHRGGKGAMMYRDFDLFVGEEHVGEAVSAWVLADMSSRRLLNLGKIAALDGTSGGELCKDISLSKIRIPKEMDEIERRKMRYSDTDINAHINNTRYADFTCDALGMERLSKDVFLSSMRLDYVKECKAGEELTISAAREEDDFIVKGGDDQGVVRFSARVRFRNVNT